MNRAAIDAKLRIAIRNLNAAELNHSAEVQKKKKPKKKKPAPIIYQVFTEGPLAPPSPTYRPEYESALREKPFKGKRKPVSSPPISQLFRPLHLNAASPPLPSNAPAQTKKVQSKSSSSHPMRTYLASRGKGLKKELLVFWEDNSDGEQFEPTWEPVGTQNKADVAEFEEALPLAYNADSCKRCKSTKKQQTKADKLHREWHPIFQRYQMLLQHHRLALEDPSCPEMELRRLFEQANHNRCVLSHVHQQTNIHTFFFKFSNKIIE